MQSPGSLIETTRDRLTLLVTLNVFQPVTLGEISTSLSKQMKGKNIEDILTALVDSGYVIKTQNNYIVSQKGLHLLGASPLKKRRDIERLLHLSSRSRRG